MLFLRENQEKELKSHSRTKRKTKLRRRKAKKAVAKSRIPKQNFEQKKAGDTEKLTLSAKLKQKTYLTACM